MDSKSRPNGYPLLFIVSAGLLANFAHAQSLKPSVDEQIKLGQEFAADIRKKEKVLPRTDPRAVLLKKNGKKS